MNRFFPVMLGLLGTFGVCCAADGNRIPADFQAALEKAEHFELLSLDPKRPEKAPADAFHGWSVLGKTTVKDAEVRKKVVAAFEKGVRENSGIAAACFNPRHGIRLTNDKKTLDLVICFECFQVQAFVADKRAAGFLVTGSPQALFDDVLKDAKVPLPAASK
jgi:hypothetical protein